MLNNPPLAQPAGGIVPDHHESLTVPYAWHCCFVDAHQRNSRRCGIARTHFWLQFQYTKCGTALLCSMSDVRIPCVQCDCISGQLVELRVSLCFTVTVSSRAYCLEYVCITRTPLQNLIVLALVTVVRHDHHQYVIRRCPDLVDCNIIHVKSYPIIHHWQRAYLSHAIADSVAVHFRTVAKHITCCTSGTSSCLGTTRPS